MTEREQQAVRAVINLSRTVGVTGKWVRTQMLQEGFTLSEIQAAAEEVVLYGSLLKDDDDNAR